MTAVKLVDRMSRPGQALVAPAGSYTTRPMEGRVMSDQSIPALPTYKDVPGFSSYRVGDDGSIWSNVTGKRLKPYSAGVGYLAVALRRDGKTCRRFVHFLVAAAFLGPRPSGADVCHRDGNRTNNVATNLRYGTRSSNLADRDAHGTHQRGERNPGAKLTNQQADEIKRRRASGEPLLALAREFNVRESTVSRIANGVRRKA